MNPKKLAQTVAKQFADESLEIFKTASTQVTGQEVSTSQETSQQSGNSQDQQKQIQNHQELQDKMRASRRIEAYQRELEDIRKQDIFKGLQQKISQGVEVPLNDYSEITMDQKQVLSAQMEAVRFQQKQSQYLESQGGNRLFGSAKKGRKMGGGQKQEAEKQQTRVEKPVPPSG